MKLLSIGIGNFRSIGEKPVRINLEKKVNVLIGANNAGKSNVLRALGRPHADVNEGTCRILQMFAPHWLVCRRQVYG